MLSEWEIQARVPRELAFQCVIPTEVTQHLLDGEVGSFACGSRDAMVSIAPDNRQWAVDPTHAGEGTAFVHRADVASGLVAGVTTEMITDQPCAIMPQLDGSFLRLQMEPLLRLLWRRCPMNQQAPLHVANEMLPG